MTETHQQLMKLPVNQVFFKYFVPATLGLILMSANILIDGLFVGNGIGTAALAGVNLSYPVISLIMAIALWIGIGGATKYSISIGENRPKKASSIFSWLSSCANHQRAFRSIRDSQHSNHFDMAWCQLRHLFLCHRVLKCHVFIRLGHYIRTGLKYFCKE